MKILHLIFALLFCLTIAANILVAQTPRGTISGTVIDENGAPFSRTIVRIKRESLKDYNRIQSVPVNGDGSFSISVESGIYVVITESPCASSRTENVEVDADQTVTLILNLVNEDCAKKKEAERAEWEACMQEWSVPGQQISDADKAELINTVLEELLRFEDQFIRNNYQEIVFSTANLDPAWVTPFPDVKYSFLSPQRLQAKADSSKEGRFFYYAFNLESGSTCAFVGISVQTAISKKNPPKKDPNVYECPVGTSKGYLFRKESGKWKMKLSRY